MPKLESADSSRGNAITCPAAGRPASWLSGFPSHTSAGVHRRPLPNVPKTASQTPRGLERDGLVSRRVGPGVPAPVEYGLTHLGRTLLGPLAAVRAWATDHIDEVEQARVAYDRGGSD